MTHKTNHVKVAIASFSSPLEVGADRSESIVNQLNQKTREWNYNTINLGVIDTPQKATAMGIHAIKEQVDVCIFAPACWFEDYLILDFIEECPAPIIFWPQPGMETGALCGTQQVTSFLSQLNHPYATVFGDIAEDDSTKRICEYIDAVSLKHLLRRSKIGFAGQRIHGMTHTSPNEFMLKKSLGPRLIPIDLPSLLNDIDEIDGNQATNHWERIKQTAAKCCVNDSEGLYSIKAYIALKSVIKQYSLNALTVGCYPHLMGKVCLAASLLADEGIPFACEGDINGAVGQLMLSNLTGQATHHTDWLDPLPQGTVIFTHCGSGSFSLAENKNDICLNSVRLMGQGVCALFPAKTGPVTCISLIPKADGYQCAILEGEAEKAEMVFPGNPVNIRFRQEPSELIEWISASGIGHHWMIGYGHVKNQVKLLESLCQNLHIIEP